MPGMMNVFLTNKAVTRDGEQYQMKRPDRFRQNLTYADLNDLTQQLLNALNQLKEYQEKDFPIGEKKILIVVTSPKKYLLRGHRLTASVDLNPPVPLGSAFSPTPRKDQSSIIQDDGQCRLNVRKQSDSEVKLILISYEDPFQPKEEQVPLATITADMLRSSGPIEIPKLPNLLEKILEVKTDPENLKGKIKIIPYDYSEYFEFYTIPFPVESSQSLIALLPGSYYYSVLFDYKNNACLNTWLVPFHIKDSRGYPITVRCANDRLYDKKDALAVFDEIIPEIKKSMDSNDLTLKLGNNELTGTFEAHLTGSPLFFRRLLEYTATKDPNAQLPEMKDLWRRIHYRLFVESKYARNIIPKMLEPALLNLEFWGQNSKRLVKRADEFLKIILEKYFKPRMFYQFTQEEKEIYNTEILEALKDNLKLSEPFVNRLRI
ncbi:MAG: hypothetical protein HQK75_18300 [Candidatus Magnetomorum sp.]|nr:hypothetical protein [Candidatus Magnetomorum sp.]